MSEEFFFEKINFLCQLDGYHQKTLISSFLYGKTPPTNSKSGSYRPNAAENPFFIVLKQLTIDLWSNCAFLCRFLKSREIDFSIFFSENGDVHVKKTY